MFQTIVIENIKTHTLCSITFFSNTVPFMSSVEKYSKAEEDADGNMAHAHFTLGA
jgi:hypothetical protein